MFLSLQTNNKEIGVFTRYKGKEYLLYHHKPDKYNQNRS